MEDIPLSAELAVLVVLLVLSGFFSIAETTMMALNRYRLKHLVAQGHGGARRAAHLLQRIDRLLWTAPAISFIPHCFPGDPLAAVTPVIVDHDGGEPPHDELLLNLRTEWPPFFSRFQRVIEIVSLDDDGRTEARARFKFYRDRGYEIRTHDLSKAGR